MKYQVKFTKQFKRDFKLARKQDQDIEKLYQVIEQLAEGKQLKEQFKDHRLTGEYSGTRECHIAPDWLLIYKLDDEILVLILTRTGSHSNLFKS
ncbi:type II toxin-antitoxin system YafQ family toxin [Lactobacillus sp. ESL0791]|uniref:type II toxin-antitoxin system YafQ family toxin n=1 Tax=Lactobacillus sp. ESL0791 TaxID=2983234 RepID=UPI0023F853C6|nr:type II toxin-antitoxin system YafQ family toxin [Lactobacillus sp. ESL0791]MDF7638127.1 type II toxin-antitoxin system YafQ family toxin [Lactobacillus sp. ESL0791]